MAPVIVLEIFNMVIRVGVFCYSNIKRIISLVKSEGVLQGAKKFSFYGLIKIN